MKRQAFRAEDTPPELMKELAKADYSHLPELVCPCGGWGLPDPSGQTYERLPCPKCGAGKPNTIKEARP